MSTHNEDIKFANHCTEVAVQAIRDYDEGTFINTTAAGQLAYAQSYAAVATALYAKWEGFEY
jgi:hypothetical protein